jgi:hypothetical protein
MRRSCALCVDLRPECVDAGSELLRYFLEGLGCLAEEYFELRAGLLGDDAPKTRKRSEVELARQHKRWHRDARQAVERVVRPERLQLALECLSGVG